MEISMPRPQIYVEKTLAIIKPDIVDKEEEIQDIIIRSGFTIVQQKIENNRALEDWLNKSWQIHQIEYYATNCKKKNKETLSVFLWKKADVEQYRRKLHFSPEQCSNFYVEQYGKMFFPNLTAYMSSGPLVAMILARHKAISYWKELLGPSNSLVAKETHPDSLRAIYGTDDLRNALHGSNDFATAEREIRFMFPEVIVEPIPVGQAAKDYLNLYVTPTLLKGLTELCKEKPADPCIWLANWLLENNPNKPKLCHHPFAEEPH